MTDPVKKPRKRKTIKGADEKSGASASQVHDQISAFEEVVDTLEDLTRTQDNEIAELKRELASQTAEHRRAEQIRFEEIAALSQKIAQQDAALKLVQSALDAEREKSVALEAAQALLRARLEGVLKGLLEERKVVKHSLSYLADRRKVQLLEALGLFDSEWYLTTNPDVKDAGSDAASHYVKDGYREGRAPLPELKR